MGADVLATQGARLSLAKITRYVEDTSTPWVTRSISGAFTHPSIVTQMSMAWSWMDDLHPFRSVSISPPISLFQTLTYTMVMSVVEGHGTIVDRVFIWLISFSFHVNQINKSWYTAILKTDLPKSKVKVMDEFKCRGYMANSIPSWCTSFPLNADRANHSWDVANRMFNFAKHIRNLKKKTIDHIFPQNLIRQYAWHGDIAIKLWSDWMIDSFLISQPIKFWFIYATAFSQGHGNITRYISPDLYSLFSKYLSFTANNFNVRCKSRWGGG